VSGFLEITSVTWEAFAKKLDEIINAIDFNVDEAIVEEYEKLANIKIKDYSTEEVKEAITETIPNTLKEIEKGLESGDLNLAPRGYEDSKGNFKLTGIDVVSGKCNPSEELDKGNAVQITENTVIVPQDKSEEY